MPLYSLSNRPIMGIRGKRDYGGETRIAGRSQHVALAAGPRTRFDLRQLPVVAVLPQAVVSTLRRLFRPPCGTLRCLLRAEAHSKVRVRKRRALPSS